MAQNEPKGPHGNGGNGMEGGWSLELDPTLGRSPGVGGLRVDAARGVANVAPESQVTSLQSVCKVTKITEGQAPNKNPRGPVIQQKTHGACPGGKW